MFHSLRAAIEVVYTTTNIWTDLPYVVIAATVFLLGTVLWFILTYFLEFFLLGNQRKRQAVLVPSGNPKLKWTWRPWKFGENTAQFSLKVFFVVGIGMIIWIAGGASGFNPWTTGAAMMVIGVIITYTLGSPLGQWGAGFGVTGSNMINVGEYWEFYGMTGYDGWITGIFALEVEMMRFGVAEKDQETTEIISMPLTQFLQAPRKRNIWKEVQAKRPWKLAGDTNMVDAKERKDYWKNTGQDSQFLTRRGDPALVTGKNFYCASPELLV
jgi:hypothetical protein